MVKISLKKILPRLVLLNLIPKTKYMELRNRLKLSGVFSCDRTLLKDNLQRNALILLCH